jgi:hypothetical protein
MVPKEPAGVPKPESGWSVEYAEAFGAPLGTGAGEDNTFKAGENNWGCCSNLNEVAVERKSQVSTTKAGLELKCEYSATGYGTFEKEGVKRTFHYACGGVSGSGAVRPFQLSESGGQTLAIVCKGKLPPNEGTADPGFCWSYPTSSGVEVDYLEGFGWGSDYTEQWKKSSSCVGCYLSGGEELCNDGFGTLEPQNIEHTYTEYIKPTSGGKVQFSFWIDGVKQLVEKCGSETEIEEVPAYTPSTGKNHLVSTYGLRKAETAAGTTHEGAGTGFPNTQLLSSIAVYEDTAHAGVGVENAGVAPGTTVE